MSGAAVKYLLASDASWVHDELRAALPGRPGSVRTVTDGRAALAAVVDEVPDLFVCDQQIGNMGGPATCQELRLEESGGRLPHVKVLLLLDRQADVYLARRAGADGWLVKPLDPLRIRKAITTVLAGERYEDRPVHGDAAPNYRPTPDATPL